MKYYKLKKELWIKGKSKFLIPRLIEEAIPFNQSPWWMTKGFQSSINQLYKKLGK